MTQVAAFEGCTARLLPVERTKKVRPSSNREKGERLFGPRPQSDCSVARPCTGHRTLVVLEVLAQILPHGDPGQIPIRFSGYGLERGGKIDRIAVGEIKTEQSMLFHLTVLSRIDSTSWIASVRECGLTVEAASAVLGPNAIQIVSARPPLRRAPPDQSTMM
jgi:hypothetical protein